MPLRGFLTFVATLACFVPASAPAKAAPFDSAYAHKIARLAGVDWKLRQVAKSQCSEFRTDFGWQLDHPALYVAKGKAIERASPQVAAVATGSPAALGGLLPGDVIIEMAGISAKRAFSITDSQALARKLLLFGADLPVNEEVKLLVQRGEQTLTIVLQPEKMCSLQSVLVTDDSIEAWSDKRLVAVTTGLVDYVLDDGELALIIAHEMAHILIAQQPERYDVRGKRLELLADEIGARLMKCAGYNLTNAAAFWLRFDETRPLSFLGSLSHPGSKKRYRRLLAIEPSLTC